MSMPMLRIFVVLCCSAVALTAAAQRAAAAGVPSRHSSDAAAPAVALEPSSLTVTAATPGEYVVVLGFQSRTIMGSLDVVSAVMARPADSAGVARFDFDTPVPQRSIFAVVDYATGRYTVATPNGFPLRLRQLRPNAWRGNPNDDFDLLDVESRWVETLCVRPGTGVWHFFATDGAGLDADRRVDDRMSVPAERMNVVLGDVVSPGKFRPRDVVIVIDPHVMDVIATEVTR